MTSPDESEPEAPDRPQRRISWPLLFKLMVSPMAFLAPCFSCSAAMTFAHSFGPLGGFLGALVGFGLGVGAIFLWYFVITVPRDDREQEFTDRMIADAEAGRLGQRLGRPRPSGISGSVEAIPLEARHALPVDITGDVGSAVGRIDQHENGTEALVAAEALAQAHSRDAHAVACLARTLLRAGRPKEGLRVAGEAFHVAVLRDQMGVVSRLVQSFWDQREELALDPSIATAIADHLQKEGQPERAAFFRSGRTSLI